MTGPAPGSRVLAAYERHVLPWLIALAMRAPAVAGERRGVVPRARGVVVEIGIGSGLNLPLYDRAAVTRVIGLDPSRRLLAMAARRARETSLPVRLIEASAERMPVEDASADTVVSTWTLCSIPDAAGAVREVGRVLRPGGQLLFIEHGRSPDRRVRGWQDRLTPVWRRIAGGCHLNRDIPALLAEGGLGVAALTASYGAGPRPMAYLFRGSARRNSSRDEPVG